MATKIKTLADVPAKWRNMRPDAAVRALRYDARLAYLDDRVAQAKKFNKYADLIERDAQSAASA